MDAARLLAAAQHEAAHVVVGVALGLRLREAVIGPRAAREGLDGYAWFAGVHRGRRRAAFALMYAAGPAWERATGGTRYTCAADLRLARAHCSSRHDVESAIRAAGALLATRGAALALVTRALLEHGTLRGRDLERLARGEPLRDAE